MGRRKLKLGRSHKNYERKRQFAKKNLAGRPPKSRNKEVINEFLAMQS